MFDLTRARAHPSFDGHQILEDLYRNQNAIPVKSGHFIPMKTEDIFIQRNRTRFVTKARDYIVTMFKALRTSSR
jgi:hypothetical protein